MTIRQAIFNCLIALTTLAVPAQIVIDPSIENVACACIVFASSLCALLYLRITTALKYYPLSSFAILGFCVTSQLGALLVQTFALTPVRHSLYDPLYTFGTLAFYQAIAIAVHVCYRFFSVPNSNSAGLARSLLAWAGIYKVPSCATLWYLGCFSLPSLLLFGHEGVLVKITNAFIFLVWAPFLIPFYSHQLGKSYCNAKLQRVFLVGYLGVIGLIGIAMNARGIMFTGVITIALLYLLAGMRSDEVLPARAVLKLSGVALVLLLFAGPLADLTTSMAIVRQARGKVPAAVMIRTTLHVWGQPSLIAAYRADQESRARYSSYDEYYIANPMLARLVETKFYDNAFHFAQSLKTDAAKARLRDISWQFVVAGLPTPVLHALGIPIDKDDLNYSMGDYLAYLSRGIPLGGRKTGNMFAQGIALFGPLFPFMYALICLALFGLMDLLTIKSTSGQAQLSTLGMLQIWTFFLSGIVYESLHKVIHLFFRTFLQTIAVYVLLLLPVRLFKRGFKNPVEGGGSIGMAAPLVK
jgi:hypothetical protein